MSEFLEELKAIDKRMAELRAICEKNAADREANGFYDDELLAECLRVLEYATYHDGRYGQVASFDKFQSPAQKLVSRLAKRLGRKAYDGYGG